MTACAFIGLGVMGFPMAGHLRAAGNPTTVYNRTASKADAWVDAHGGSSAPTPREAAAGAEAVMVCVGNDDDIRSVTVGEGGGAKSFQAFLGAFLAIEIAKGYGTGDLGGSRLDRGRENARDWGRHIPRSRDGSAHGRGCPDLAGFTRFDSAGEGDAGLR